MGDGFFFSLLLLEPPALLPLWTKVSSSFFGVLVMSSTPCPVNSHDSTKCIVVDEDDGGGEGGGVGGGGVGGGGVGGGVGGGTVPVTR